MDMDNNEIYKNKYLKYKIKYYKLLNLIKTQIGGPLPMVAYLATKVGAKIAWKGAKILAKAAVKTVGNAAIKK